MILKSLRTPIYATAKLDEMAFFIEKEVREKGYFEYYTADAFWKHLSLKMPCETFEKYPNASIDGLMASLFEPDGSFNASDTLAKISGSVFACPSHEFHTLEFHEKPSIQDLARVHAFLSGIDLNRWFMHQKSPEDTVIKPHSNVPKFPKFDFQSAMKKLEASSDPNDILMLTLLRHTFDPDQDINATAAMLEGIKDQLNLSYIVDDFKPEAPYDGSDRSMV